MTMKLTPDQEAVVKQVVDAGLAESAEAFVSEALRDQQDELAQNAAVKQWLRDVVVPAHEEFMKDPSQGRTLAQMRAELLDD
ncbi:MAG: hypothetical protein AAFY02_02175 [Pseudomonadota bacterium]